uniref:ZP domain-containing protein n=1 Tax=Ascaris lumbricoides TaxID=6252 RepID=A0A0M3HNV1_ASCLU
MLLALLLIPPTFAYVDNYVLAKPFRGNIFVKGHTKDSSCRQSYANDSSNSYSVSLGNCGMQRLRSINPRGINFIVTLIVSFHPAGFITKNDRAFNVKCFYVERDEVVTAAVKVFHVWECSGAEMGMLVKKCFVTDGEGEQHAVIDFDGQATSYYFSDLSMCSTDSFLLSELTYDATTMRAQAQSHVFKYADSNQLYFTCQIELCHKNMGLCAGITPPNCAEQSIHKHRRSVNWMERQLELDVSTPEMLIADVDEATETHRITTCRHVFFLALLPFILLTFLSIFLSVVTVMKKSSSKWSICPQIPYLNPC